MGKFFPAFAGVAFSRNEFRWSPRIRRTDGIIRLVAGWAPAVDRVGEDYPVLISPGQPNLRVNVTPEDVLRYSQKYIDVINLESRRFETLTFFDRLLAELGHDFPALSQIVAMYGRVRRAAGGRPDGPEVGHPPDHLHQTSSSAACSSPSSWPC